HPVVLARPDAERVVAGAAQDLHRDRRQHVALRLHEDEARPDALRRFALRGVRDPERLAGDPDLDPRARAAVRHAASARSAATIDVAAAMKKPAAIRMLAMTRSLRTGGYAARKR